MTSLLFTGSDEDLMIIQLLLNELMNFHEQRNRTLFGTCEGKHVKDIIDLCKGENITLEQLWYLDNNERYTLLNRGKCEPWAAGEVIN